MNNMTTTEKMKNNLSATLIAIAIIVGGFLILNLIYLKSISSAVEKVSIETKIQSEKFKELESQLQEEKERLAFAAHVVDIKNILERYRPNTGNVSYMDFAYIIAKESFEKGLDPFLVLAVIKTESSFREYVVSHKGAIGLMQILPNTGQYVSDMQENINLKSASQLFDPKTNVRIGISYLSYLVNKFNNQKYALIAYNMGPTNVIRKIRNGRNPSEKYYRTVMKNYQQILSLSNKV
jgi:soluble lytic murein transglycosylase